MLVAVFRRANDLFCLQLKISGLLIESKEEFGRMEIIEAFQLTFQEFEHLIH